VKRYLANYLQYTQVFITELVHIKLQQWSTWCVVAEISMNTSTLDPVAQLAWQKGVCCGRAAFDRTDQNKARFSAGVLRPNQSWLVA